MYLTRFLSDSTKYDIVVILVFFSELFDEYLIRGSMRPFFITWVFLRIRGVLKKKTPRIPKKLTL